MLINVITDRLSINYLTVAESDFILELVNTPGWLEFIGDRQIKTAAAATDYIQKIIDSPKVFYWVVKLKKKKNSIGIITIIKRDYLSHYDIGFAFLPAYAGRGYAFEAAKAVLDSVKKDMGEPPILATTITGNVRSIRLLEKLGFNFDKEIQVEDKKLLLYSLLAT